MAQSSSVRTTERTEDQGNDRYTVRPYERDDAADVLDLYRTVWGSEHDADWLAYKYVKNPYFDGTSMLVAETDDTVVGARPAVPVPMRVGDTDLAGLFLVSVMVHPEHRRRGLFTRMMAHGFEHFADAGVSLCFNYSNELSAPGYRQLGAERLGTGPGKHVRVQRPGRFVDSHLPAPADEVAHAVANGMGRGYRAVRDGLAVDLPALVAASGLGVDRRDRLAPGLLARLYERDPPDGLHTRREPTFYRWLADNPGWTYETYVAWDGPRSVAALLVKRRPGDDSTVVLADAVPACTPSTRPAFATLLRAVLADNRDAANVSTYGLVHRERLLPADLLSRFGFRSDGRPPLSRVTPPDDTAFTLPLDDTVARVHDAEGVDLLDGSNWRLRLR
ncbi:GNAT family N-acetyltransferase [Haloarchaeobius salinus]|uniref:GNAT family N-acetyltransferase n=1 Tax=Haloarchaeobius salinus TaxID=1198298 RepID=UPI00210A7335|nr:GNAT family N-acetyltransferase [Haloarchaeobius salinus]